MTGVGELRGLRPQAAEPPLVSLFVLAYRQEAHVRAAIEGAFAQTYAPLEIVLSDDASPDGTFAVMQEMAAAYAGPHAVILNRNPANLGLIGHINRVMALTRGGFVVQNAGDDVSHPERTARLVAAWQAGQGVRAVHSAMRRLDARGRVAPYPPRRPPMADVGPGEVIADGLHLIGASMGWDRRLWDVFGPLPAATSIEDRPIAFRAALTGTIAWIDAPLLDYREGGESDPATLGAAGTGPGGYYLKKQRWYRGFYRSYLADLERAPPPDAADLRRRCAAALERLDFEIGLAEAGYAGRLARIPRALKLALARREPALLRAQLKYLLPARR